MADLTLKEKLQPSLLDRLTDRDPDSKLESRDRRVLSVDKIRESVVRDLGWLLNTGCLGASQDLVPYPDVERSVLNFGVPDLAGITASSFDISMLENALRDAIVNFEPRILQESLRVRIEVGAGHVRPGTLRLEIDGQLWAQPVPVNLYLRTELDLETGSYHLTEGSR